MCVSLEAQVEIPEEQLLQRYTLPGYPLKRAEYHTQLCGLVWKRNDLAFALGANQDIGVTWRVPLGEIWSMLYMRFAVTFSAVVNWSAINPTLYMGLPICLNGLFDGSKESRQLVVGAAQTQAASATFNKTWCRSGIVSSGFFWHEWCERQCCSVEARTDGAGTWSAVEVGMIYYRTRLYDKLLDDLRKAEGDDCEVQKLLAAAYPWVNDRNDSDW